MAAIAYVVLLTLNGLYQANIVLSFAPELGKLVTKNLGPVLIGWWTVWAALAALLIVDAVLRARAGDIARLRRSMAIVKFGSIPFFVVNFLLLAILVAISVASAVRLGPFAIPLTGATWTLSVLATFAIFLPTSAHSIALVILLRRQRPTERRSIIGIGISQILFVLDLIGAIILLGLSKNASTRPNLTTQTSHTEGSGQPLPSPPAAHH